MSNDCNDFDAVYNTPLSGETQVAVDELRAMGWDFVVALSRTLSTCDCARPQFVSVVEHMHTRLSGELSKRAGGVCERVEEAVYLSLALSVQAIQLLPSPLLTDREEAAAIRQRGGWQRALLGDCAVRQILTAIAATEQAVRGRALAQGAEAEA